VLQVLLPNNPKKIRRIRNPKKQSLLLLLLQQGVAGGLALAQPPGVLVVVLPKIPRNPLLELD
jgi:hypothetical protein